MKFFNIIVIVFLFVLAACQQKSSTPDYIILGGMIENAMGDSLAIYRNDDVLSKIALDQEGRIYDTLDLTSDYYDIVYKGKFTTVYLQEGDSLEMNVDMRKFDESLDFSGPNSEVNNYLADKKLLRNEIGKKLDIRTLYGMEEDSFSSNIKKIEAEFIDLYNKASLPQNFADIERENIRYEMIYDTWKYESYHGYFSQKDSFETSASFKQQFESLDFTDEALFMTVPKYREMVVMHFSSNGLDSLEHLDAIESQKIRNAVGEWLSGYLSPGTENLEEKVEALKSRITDEDLLNKINESYESMKGLVKGNPSPSFEFKSVDDKMVSLSELKGKNVYIDVWATWCGPCKMEIPHLQKLEEDYHDKNIEFVSISVDVPEDEQKWRDMIADKDLKGIQLISDNGWETDFVENYLINGIPRFILLDSEGNIITADAPRPSSNEEIRRMIDALLI